MLKRIRTVPVLLAGVVAIGAWAVAGQDQDYGKQDEGKQDEGYAKKAAYAEPLTESQRQEIAGLFERLMTVKKAMPVSDEPCCEAGAPCEGCETIESSSKALVAWLSKNPGSWEVVTPMVTDCFVAKATTSGQRDLMFRLLGWTESKQALEVGATLWKKGPKYFSEDHVLAFAEAGSEPLLAECRRRAQAGASGVRPAALVALSASKYGNYGQAKKEAKAYEAAAGTDWSELEQQMKAVEKSLVEAVCVRVLDENSTPDALLAAASLESLGNAEAFGETQGRVHDAVIAALDGGQLERARQMALQAEFFHEATSSGSPLKVSYMDERLKYHFRERSEEVETADQVFDLIERITPL